MDGLWVGAEQGGERGLRRAEEALDIIKQHDRHRYNRIRGDIERVWVRVIPGALARFNEALSACELDARFVLDEASPLEVIAAAIVHEATHARIARCGIAYEEDKRHRIEAICIRRELAFAARLHDGEQVRVWAKPQIGYRAYRID